MGDACEVVLSQLAISFGTVRVSLPILRFAVDQAFEEQQLSVPFAARTAVVRTICKPVAQGCLAVTCFELCEFLVRLLDFTVVDEGTSDAGVMVPGCSALPCPASQRNDSAQVPERSEPVSILLGIDRAGFVEQAILRNIWEAFQTGS